MNHSCKSIKLAEQYEAGMSSTVVATVSRRRFLTLFTAGAASLALQACGGGNTGSGSDSSSAAQVSSVTPVTTTPTTPSTPAVPTTPAIPDPLPVAPAIAWSTVPTISFTQGVASSISVAQWLSGANGAAVAISLNAVALPPGVTFNATTRSLDYDGVGGAVTSEGHVLLANGG